jgi:hypothetical protein
MWIVGGFMLFNFGTDAVAMWKITPDELHQRLVEQQQMVGQSAAMPAMPEGFLRWATLVISVIAALVGLAMFCLAFGVRRGRRGQTLTAAILASVIGGVLLLFLICCVLAGLVMPPMLLFAVVVAIPLGLFVLMIFWLFAALKSARYSPATAIGWQQMQPGAQIGSLGYSAYQPVAPAPTAPPSVLGYGYPGLTPPPPPAHGSSPPPPSNGAAASPS